MSLAPKTPPCLALTVIIRQIDSNHQNYLGRAVVFYFCIFVFSEKYKFHTLHFVFLYFSKNANSTLCIFFCIFVFCILFVFFVLIFVLFLYFFGICTFWKIQKYKKMYFLENTKIQNTKNCESCIFLKIQKCNINKNLRLVFVQKMQKKTEPICLQVANYRNYNENPRGTKLPRLFCNNSR